MKNIFGIVLVIIIVGSLVYGGWILERNLNYKWSYQSMVKQEISVVVNPLNARIQKLEAEIEILKKK